MKGSWAPGAMMAVVMAILCGECVSLGGRGRATRRGGDTGTGVDAVAMELDAAGDAGPVPACMACAHDAVRGRQRMYRLHSGPLRAPG